LARAGNIIRQSLGDRGADGSVSVGDCIKRLRPLLEQLCGEAIGLELRIGILPRIRCRDLDLDNALINLALNARDAMPSGGTLSIIADIAEGPEVPEVEIVVADCGHGMPPEVLARARESFFTTKSDRGGRGLGLSSVARFVERIDGRLSIESTPGAGTSVTMRLPVGDLPALL
jgi:signal transduction histidine kinase